MEDFNSKYSGEQVEALLDQVASGNAGGGGGIAVETDPVFSASPAASITEDDKEAWDNKVGYATKNLGLVGADGFMTSEGEGFVLPNTQAAQGGHGLVLATLDDIPDALTESDITAMGFTKNEGTVTGVKVNGETKSPSNSVVDLGTVGTYTKPSTGIPASDLAEDVFLQGEKGEKGDKGDKGDTGANGTNGTDGKDGADGEDGATFTPSVDSEGNLSWSNNKGLANPPTVNIKGPKGDSGEGSGSSTGGGKEVVIVSTGVIEELLPNKIYILETLLFEALVFEIQSIVEPEWDSNNSSYAEYTVIIIAEGLGGGDVPTIILPDNVNWANGQIPDLTQEAIYELSIVGFSSVNNGGFNAVITPFKPA